MITILGGTESPISELSSEKDELRRSRSNNPNLTENIKIGLLWGGTLVGIAGAIAVGVVVAPVIAEAVATYGLVLGLLEIGEAVSAITFTGMGTGFAIGAPLGMGLGAFFTTPTVPRD